MILHKCTKNHDHNTGYTVPEIWHVTGCNCSFLFFILDYFLPFYQAPLLGPPPNSPKNLKISKKFKKRLELPSFYTSVPKQGYGTIARLITKFRGYRRVKSRTPPSKYACGGVRWLFLLEHHSFLSFTMKSTNYN